MQWRFSCPHMVILLAGACRADAQHMEKKRKLYFNNKIKAGKYRREFQESLKSVHPRIRSLGYFCFQKEKEKNNPTKPPIVYENGLLYEESSAAKVLLLCRNVSMERRLSAAYAFVFPDSEWMEHRFCFPFKIHLIFI